VLQDIGQDHHVGRFWKLEVQRLFQIGLPDRAIGGARQFHRGRIGIDAVQREIGRRQQLAQQALRAAHIVHDPRALREMPLSMTLQPRSNLPV
jgi:hypothetical protein